ncbi:translocation/assembly module TamB domain-containing protein [Alteromonas gilva]|uniref:Translocation/assembly module TamB domain-containing protein n=1 Tax=Alteromonas gilva TaxID=2987522 RepID=A0ABT5KWT4_9ALTE|nr:translocation/assembly module TamB domain-containing protein [Alteromonas gilva]MDC8829230.1 translocation/assembly module TamB domain-containing protein [Alteromonas gilva]
MANPLHAGARTMTINRLAKIFLVTLLLLLGLVVLVLSPLGTPAINYAANKFVPGLTLETVSGSLLSKITFEGIHWQNAQWQVDVDAVTVAHEWTCLLKSAVCIEQATLTTPRIVQTSRNEPATEEPAPAEDISLPFALFLDSLNITNAYFESPAVTLEMTAGNISAEWLDSLVVNELMVNVLTVQLPESEPQPATPLAIAYQAPVLPEIVLPLAVELHEVTLGQLTVSRAQQQLVSLSASLQHATAKGSTVVIDTLQVDTPEHSATATAEVTLAGEYPLSLTLDSTLTLAQQSQRLALTAKGELSALTLDIKGEGPITAATAAQVNLLSDQLPLSLQAHWPQQSLSPFVAGQLSPGTLSAQGEMGGYSVQLDGGANLDELTAVTVKARALLGKHSLAVSTLDATLFNGEISNSGVMYFSEALSWQGTTNIVSLDLDTWLAQGPQDINGGMKSHVNMSEQGPNVLLSELALSGTHLNELFTIAGDVVYSANSDIVVANLNADIAENQLTIAGQVLNQQYLDALITLDLQQLATLYPDISGQVTGSVAVKGDWADPVIDSRINLQNVVASRALSPIAAGQGALNGDIAVSGSLASHRLQADLQLPEHTTQLNLEGHWQQQVWQATLSDSQLAILNTSWQQQSDLQLTYKQQQQQFMMSQHCWQAREEGELCINSLNYTPQQITWDLSANLLPVGLWANEVFPEMLAKRNNATLSLTTAGQFTPQSQQATGSFSASISPDSWELGSEPSVSINLDTFNLNGEFTDSQLSVDASITSPEIGNISTQLTIDPFTQTPQLQGKLQLSQWQLAPFQHLINNMQELDGQIDGTLELQGPVNLPAVTGQLSLKQGSINSDDLPVVVSDWQQTIEFFGDNATFDGSYMLGDGAGSIAGKVNWQDELIIDVDLKGNAFTVHYDASSVKVSPNLSAHIDPQGVDIAGDINIPWARINITELPPSAISPSRDVHLRGEPPSDALVDNINANVSITLDKGKKGEVRLDAFGLTAALSGGINVQTQPAITGYGDLQILNGRYEAWGQNLIIRTGEVQFNGPINQPLLLVEAIRDPKLTEDDVIAGVRIDGLASEPSISLFSEPSMDQAQNLAYLLNGSGSLRSSGQGDNGYAAMLIGLGLSRTEGITSNVGKTLGIEDFAVTTTGQGNDTKLAVSGKIAPNLTVRYGVAMFENEGSAGQEVALRYQVWTNLYIEVVRSLSTAVDMYYQFTLGDQDKQESNDDTND